MATEPDMMLVVNVAVSGTIDSTGIPLLTAVYSLACCNPAGAASPVDGQGNVDLNNMGSNPAFSDETDITFNLTGTVSDAGGTEYPVIFQDKPATLTPASGNGKVKDITVKFPVSSNNYSQLVLDDQDNDNDDYNYTLNILVLNSARTKGSLDPAIVNR